MLIFFFLSTVDVHSNDHSDHVSEPECICVTGNALHAQSLYNYLSPWAKCAQTQAQLQGYCHSCDHVKQAQSTGQWKAKRRGENWALWECGQQQWVSFILLSHPLVTDVLYISVYNQFISHISHYGTKSTFLNNISGYFSYNIFNLDLNWWWPISFSFWYLYSVNLGSTKSEYSWKGIIFSSLDVLFNISFKKPGQRMWIFSLIQEDIPLYEIKVTSINRRIVSFSHHLRVNANIQALPPVPEETLIVSQIITGNKWYIMWSAVWHLEGEKKHTCIFCWVLPIKTRHQHRSTHFKASRVISILWCSASLLSVNTKPLCLIFKNINIYGYSWAGYFSLCSQVMACEPYLTVSYYNFIHCVT